MRVDTGWRLEWGTYPAEILLPEATFFEKHNLLTYYRIFQSCYTQGRLVLSKFLYYLQISDPISDTDSICPSLYESQVL